MKGQKPLVILGSARKESDTKKFVHQLFSNLEFETIDLLDYKIHPYNYSTKYPHDDSFHSIIKRILIHDTIIFATPVYWYSMSGLMKTFFDRLTDIVTVNKKYGRQLEGKKTFLVSVGTDKKLPEGFEVPFRQTSAYFNMKFMGFYYHDRKRASSSIRDNLVEKIKNFNSS